MKLKKQITVFVILLFSFAVKAQGEFITIWQPNNPSTQVYDSNATPLTLSTSNQIYFPGSGYNYKIDWEEIGNPNHKGILSNVNSSFGSPILIDFGSSTATNPKYMLKVTNGSGNFYGIYFSAYYGDQEKIITVEQWGTTKWSTMNGAFSGCKNMDVLATDVPNLSNVTSTVFMFSNCKNLKGNSTFNLWNTSNITNMEYMFSGAESFNQNIGSWNTSKVTHMYQMFAGAKQFNQNIGNWDLSNAVNIYGMFSGATNFNQNIGNWNISKATSLSFMFDNATNFNQNLSTWDTSNITSMTGMFQYATNFNQNIGNWNTSKVTSMGTMFAQASSFNQNIGNWDTSNVTEMSGMFQRAYRFNQNIGGWNVSKVKKATFMFLESDFNQNIGNWNLKSLTNAIYIFNLSKMSCDNYNKTLIGWANNSDTPNGIDISPLSPLKYSSTDAVAARTKLRTSKGWTISGDSYNPSCLLSTNEVSEPLKIEIYPNPSSEFFYFKNAKENDLVSLYDISGKLVRKEKLNSQKQVFVKGMKNGNYIAIINGDSYKLIVK